MTAGLGRGILAIWNNIRDGSGSDFELWYQHEHFLERIAVPGFLRGRRYEVIEGTPRYFCYYVTETPEVLLSAAYLARLNDPTPLTRTMMSGVFRDMIRTACRREASWGRMSGACAVTVRMFDAASESRLTELADGLATDTGVARCELWSAVDQDGHMAEEERLRGGDRKIVRCLLVDTLRQEKAVEIRDRLRAELPDTAEIGIYRLLCEIERHEDC